ncbi:MAG: hypothetical protein QM497_03080 [Sulfurimonas sp.]
MELKDVILSTLAEMEEEIPEQVLSNISNDFEVKETKKLKEEEMQEATQSVEVVSTSSNVETELMYLSSIRERLLVLFEGFQAPNNINIEAKVDMTLNFLEYVLATIDTRVQNLEKENK